MIKKKNSNFRATWRPKRRKTGPSSRSGRCTGTSAPAPPSNCGRATSPSSAQCRSDTQNTYISTVMHCTTNSTRVLRFKSPNNDLNKSKIAGSAALQHPRGDHRRRLQQVRPQAQLRDLGVKGVQATWQHCTKPKCATVVPDIVSSTLSIRDEMKQ